jgi:twinkle protein
MARIIKYRLPCRKCGSSDAVAEYEDHSSFCFSCNHYYPSIDAVLNNKVAEEVFTPSPEDIAKVKRAEAQIFAIPEMSGFGAIPARKIGNKVTEFYGVRVTYDANRKDLIHYYPYNVDELGVPSAYKIRKVADKKFESIGKIKGLFGQHLFSPGGKRIIITEGEIDALTLAQVDLDKYDKIYPVLSVRSASTVSEDLLASRDFIRSFDEVVLCFDPDKAGKKALEAACKIIGFDKVKVANFGKFKDPNEAYVKGNAAGVISAIWSAQPYVPSGIISTEDLWTALSEYNKIESLSYPECLSGLNNKLQGIRLGEIDLFVSGTGSGKSTVFRELILNIMVKAGPADKVGILSLEEAPAETARRVSGMAINRNTANEDVPLEELKIGFDMVFGTGRILLLDHQGSVEDNSLLETIEYMALMGAKYIMLDHITIATSEGMNNLSGNEAVDSLMSSLLKLVKRHNFWLGIISHLRKSSSNGKSYEEGLMPNLDAIKGSSSIKQISFGVIAFARDQVNADPLVRSTIDFSVLKNRYTGLTGPVPPAYYNGNTGRLQSEPALGAAFERIVPKQKIEVIDHATGEITQVELDDVIEDMLFSAIHDME